MAVLISIKPKYCDLIFSGKKTIEVRKTKPKCGAPFKCFIYCTMDKHDRFICRGDDDMPFDVGNGMVIGEFVCDDIFSYWAGYAGNMGDDCITYEEAENYLSEKMGYGWHISDLKIYDNPKELRDFHKPCTPECNYSEECGGTNAAHCLFSVTRAPQSWMYVEELI